MNLHHLRATVAIGCTPRRQVLVALAWTALLLVPAVRQWLTVIALVAIGQGVALVPSCMQRAGIAGVRFVPVDTFDQVLPVALEYMPTPTAREDKPAAVPVAKSKRADRPVAQ